MQNLTDIYNWRRVNERLTTSGQPSENQLGEIQKIGVTHIINLGMHDHERALADEATSVTNLGMEYIHIPVVFDNPTQADFKEFMSAMTKTSHAHVHVHCIANLRVSAFLYKYWRDITGMNENQARKLMDTVWRPGGVWAAFIGDSESIHRPHKPPIED